MRPSAARIRALPALMLTLGLVSTGALLTTVALKPGVAVTGRLIDPVDGSPVPDVAYEADFWSPGGEDGQSWKTRSAGSSDRTDSEGRFHVRADAPSIAAARIVFGKPGEPRRALVVEEPAEAVTALDLGDIPLATLRNVPFRVVDAAGRPVEGAVARVRDWTESTSRPTDAAGLGVVPDAGAECRALRVAAPNKQTVQVELPPGPGRIEEPVLVSVEPSATLRVHVDGDGALPEDLLVAVYADEPPFENGWGFNYLETRVGATERSIGGHARGAGGWRGFRVGRGGRPVVVANLKAGVPFQVGLSGRSWGRSGHHGAYWTEPVEMTLEPGELRTASLRWAPQRQAVALHVVDEGGLPVRGASLEFQCKATRRTLRARSDLHGRAEFVTLAPMSGILSVRADGKAPAFVPDLRIAAGENDREIVLETGTTLRVRTVHVRTGEPVEAPVWAQIVVPGWDGPAAPGVSWAQPDWRSPGEPWTFPHIPADAELTITYGLLGEERTVRCRADASEVRVETELGGTLEVDAAVGPSPRSRWSVHLRRPGSSGAVMRPTPLRAGRRVPIGNVAGDYELWLGETRREPHDPYEERTAQRAPVRLVHVPPGETVRVTLTPEPR